ncbi:hypothetical protein FEM48_Zijuj02G0091100 [Ziziphus jujuba var. spinosa]|uniref:Reverse transcriptase zinc-binding domain-containing protein n=1 Tax=Ziziphus jujuba var. spinosa TaxID=714518 RepID=A0A978VUV4_ZIZJJ|nr:hypothetical protein FEM48_Zijuj02G0091100 [Ziziphus jujuba var. spinosa]
MKGLMTCGFSLPSTCDLCFGDLKSSRHLFLSCLYAHCIWDYISLWFPVVLDTSVAMVDFFLHCMNMSLSPQLTNLFQAAVFPAISSIWHAQNQSRFSHWLIFDYVWCNIPVYEKRLSKPLRPKVINIDDDFKADFQNFKDDLDVDDDDDVLDVKPFTFST